MRKKRKIDNRMTSEEIFLQKLSEERHKERSLILKLEVFPTHGGMKGYKVFYIPASNIMYLEKQLLDGFGPGRFFLRLVDDNHRPLEQFGYLWLDLENPDKNSYILEVIDCEINEAKKKLKKLGGDYPPGERAAEFAEMATVGLQGIGDIWRLLGNKHEDEL